MKDFFKNVFATVIGVFLTFGIIIAFGVISLIGTLASSSSQPEIKDNSVLVLNLQGNITEKSGEDILGMLTGNETNTLGLNDILAAIEKAKGNDKIKGIYIKAGIIASDYATLQEIRAKLLEFKQTKKWIVAYGDDYMQGTYYLASVADKVYLNPLGHLEWRGIASQPMYYKDMLEKIGVRFNAIKVGTYKSATELFTETGMSEANREQVTKYITGLWENVVNEVSKSRGISVSQLNTYADGVMLFENAADIKAKKMVDQLLYADQVKAEVKKRLGIDSDEAVNQVSVKTMAASETKKGVYAGDGDEIAVYYCQGDIVMSNTAGYSSPANSQIVAKDVCKDMENLMNDDDVKAVVIRINSGGGDAYASEQMWHYISELKKVKPVVVSMGGLAASGGYYMACNASWIVAEPTTLTGSIGIFGLLPDMSGLLTQKLGLRFDEVKTHKNSAFSPVATARPLTEDEIAFIQTYINKGYELFRKRVADGRKMKVEDVEKIAQGRVWLGQDAMKLKLVDQLGTLDAAVKKAAALAKLNEYHTADYPAQADWTTQLISQTVNGGGNELDEQLRRNLGAFYEPFVLVRTLNEQSPIQARIPFILNMK